MSLSEQDCACDSPTLPFPGQTSRCSDEDWSLHAAEVHQASRRVIEKVLPVRIARPTVCLSVSPSSSSVFSNASTTSPTSPVPSELSESASEQSLCTPSPSSPRFGRDAMDSPTTMTPPSKRGSRGIRRARSSLDCKLPHSDSLSVPLSSSPALLSPLSSLPQSRKSSPTSSPGSNIDSTSLIPAVPKLLAVPSSSVDSEQESAVQRELKGLLDRAQAEFEQDSGRLKGAIDGLRDELIELTAHR
jgi:hypothetical protein